MSILETKIGFVENQALLTSEILALCILSSVIAVAACWKKTNRLQGMEHGSPNRAICRASICTIPYSLFLLAKDITVGDKLAMSIIVWGMSVYVFAFLEVGLKFAQFIAGLVVYSFGEIHNVLSEPSRVKQIYSQTPRWDQ